MTPPNSTPLVAGAIGLVHVRLLVGHDADGKAADAREAANHRLAVLGTVFVEVAVVDDARDDLLHVVLFRAVSVEDAVNLAGIIARRMGFLAIEDAELTIAHLVNQRANAGNAGFVVGFAVVDGAADLGVHFRAA